MAGGSIDSFVVVLNRVCMCIEELDAEEVAQSRDCVLGMGLA